jgi:hypothetical protein
MPDATCPLSGPCTDCDRTAGGCVQVWGPDDEWRQAIAMNAAIDRRPCDCGTCCAIHRAAAAHA